VEQIASPNPTAPTSTPHPTRTVLYLDPHEVIIVPTPSRENFWGGRTEFGRRIEKCTTPKVRLAEPASEGGYERLAAD